jgi:hypothetical protein
MAFPASRPEEGRAGAHDDRPIVAADPGEATIVLHVVNYAALSPDVLDETRARVAKIYGAIGVRIEWVDSDPPLKTLPGDGLHLTVMLLSRDMAQKMISAQSIPDHVLGTAHLASGRAHIFRDRIATMPGAIGFFATRLGDVIAHEVGHLVLTRKAIPRAASCAPTWTCATFCPRTVGRSAPFERLWWNRVVNDELLSQRRVPVEDDPDGGRGRRFDGHIHQKAPVGSHRVLRF